MTDDTPAALGALRVDEGKLRNHVDEVVRSSVEETLNGLLDAEAEQICGAQRYERSPERVDSNLVGEAGSLSVLGAQGGPEFLSATAAAGTNTVTDPNYVPMTLFDAWSTNTGTSKADKMRQSIYRGEQIFNLRPFTISNVTGFNDVPPANNSFPGGCAFCHSQANAGTDVFPRSQQDIGTTGTSKAFGGSPPANDLPVFELTCKAGTSTPYLGSMVRTNDPGLALITGKCADIGKVTVSTLRGLAARAPYFHDGSAATLMDVVNFYDRRFSIGLSAQDKIDLVNFLNAL